MGRHRKDRSLEDWLSHGDSLLTLYGSRSTVRKKIKALLEGLKVSAKQQDEKNQNFILAQLNNYKYELGDNWTVWTKRFRQRKVDENRKRIFVTKKASMSIERIKEEDVFDKDSTALEHTLLALNKYGIGSLTGFIDALEKLSKYRDRKSELKTSNLNTNTEEINVISFFESLDQVFKKHQIVSFEDLKKTLNFSRENRSDVEEVIRLKRALRAHDLTVNKLTEGLNNGDLIIEKTA